MGLVAPAELLAPALSGNIFLAFSLLHPLNKWSLRQTRRDSYSRKFNVVRTTL